MAKLHQNTPRGVRNNNPLNIRKGDKWQGLSELQNDKDFAVFRCSLYGFRAAFIILKKYLKRRLNTPRLIISSWAPDCENNTAAYVNTVCKEMNLSPDSRLEWKNKNMMCRLVLAMAHVECGTAYDWSFGEIENAYALANLQ